MNKDGKKLYVLSRGLGNSTYYALYNPENKKHIRVFQISGNKIRNLKGNHSVVFINTESSPLSKSDIIKRIKVAREFERLVTYLKCSYMEIDTIARTAQMSLSELSNISNPEYYLKCNSDYLIDNGRTLLRYAISSRNLNDVRIRVDLRLNYI